MNITSLNYERVLNDHPEFENIINLSALERGTVDHYTTGVHGIANAYIRKDDGSYLIINRKNAMYAMMLNGALSIQDVIPFFENPLRNFDALVYMLLPQDNDCQMINNGFFRRMFKQIGIKDDIRNALNSKAFKALFEYNLTSRYEKISPIGNAYTEEEIQQIGNDLYEEEKGIQTDKAGGFLKMTERTRYIISEKVSKTLAEVYGWEYKMREYDDIIIDQDLMTCVCDAFPLEKAVIDEIISIAHGRLGGTPQSARMLLSSEDTNPIAQSESYRRAQERGLSTIEEMIGYTDEDAGKYIERHAEEGAREAVFYTYLTGLVRDFVLETNDLRGVEYTSDMIESTTESIASFIFTKMLRFKR